MFKNEKSWLNYAVCLGFDSLQSVTKKLATSKKKKLQNHLQAKHQRAHAFPVNFGVLKREFLGNCLLSIDGAQIVRDN